jgi:hypothetical protein
MYRSLGMLNGLISLLILLSMLIETTMFGRDSQISRSHDRTTAVSIPIPETRLKWTRSRLCSLKWTDTRRSGPT